jgi:predicted transcriptional regulator
LVWAVAACLSGRRCGGSLCEGTQDLLASKVCVCEVPAVNDGSTSKNLGHFTQTFTEHRGAA